MNWCWLLGHRWVQWGTNIMGEPTVFCSRCRKASHVATKRRS